MRLRLHRDLHLLVLNDLLQLHLIILLPRHQHLLLDHHIREQVVLILLRLHRRLHMLRLFTEDLEILSCLLLQVIL